MVCEGPGDEVPNTCKLCLERFASCSRSTECCNDLLCSRGFCTIPASVICSTLAPFDAGEGANGHLYGIVNVPFDVNFHFASDYAGRLNSCCDKDAHLASITSQPENDFVANLLPRLAWGTWIGLNNMNQSDYVWDSSSDPVDYTNWCGPPARFCDAQEPDRPTNSCTTMNERNGLWYDWDCASPLFPYFAVEYDCD
jgi:hypothetical protein